MVVVHYFYASVIFVPTRCTVLSVDATLFRNCTDLAIVQKHMINLICVNQLIGQRINNMVVVVHFQKVRLK